MDNFLNIKENMYAYDLGNLESFVKMHDYFKTLQSLLTFLVSKTKNKNSYRVIFLKVTPTYKQSKGVQILENYQEK